MAEKIKISVALAACGGEKYIAQQLQSLLDQSRRPDEIIICDDSKDDLTAKAVEPFLSGNIVKYYPNSTPLGVVKNFEKAILLCSGECIFLSDQDDVWLPQKIEKMSSILENDDSVDGVFCNSSLVDENLEPLNKTLWQLRKFTPSMQKVLSGGNSLKVFLKRVTLSGHNIAFKRRMLENMLPFPELAPFYSDTWIALYIALNGKWQALDESLTLYRVHKNNFSNPVSGNFQAAQKARRNSAALRNMLLAEELLKRSNHAAFEQKKLIEEFALHHKIRSQYSRYMIFRTVQIAREICSLRYKRYSGSLRTATADIFFKK